MSSIITYYCVFKGISNTTEPSKPVENSKALQTEPKVAENKNTKQKQSDKKQTQKTVVNKSEPVPHALLYYCTIKQIPIQSNSNNRDLVRSIPDNFGKERQENVKNQKVSDIENVTKENFAKERQENFTNQRVVDIENVTQETQGLYPPADPIHLPNSDPQQINYAPLEGALYPPTDPIHLPGDQYTPLGADDGNFLRNSDYPPANPNDLDIDEKESIVFPAPDTTNTIYPPTDVGTHPLQPIHDIQQGFYPPVQPGYSLPPSDPSFMRNSDYPPTNPNDLPSNTILHSQTVNISTGGGDNTIYPPTDPNQINQPYIATLEGVTSPASIKYASIYNNPVEMYPPDQVGAQYGFNSVPVNLRNSGAQLPNVSGFFPTVPADGPTQASSGFFAGPPPVAAPTEGVRRRNTFSVPQEYQELYPTPVREVLPEIASHLNNFPIQLNQSGNLPTGNLEFPGGFSATPQSPADILFSANQSNTQSSRLASQLFSDIFTRADKNDDGNITFDEFTGYFEEQVLNKEELKDLFYQADLNHNQNISLNELEEFFKASFQTYSGLFESLGQMHAAISVTLNVLYQHYPYENRTNQFTTRVLINEFLLQIKSLFETVHASLESLQVASTGSVLTDNSEQHYEEPTSSNRQVHESNSNNDLREQVNRLASIVNKLANAQARLQPVQKDSGTIYRETSFLVVSRTFEVSNDSGALSAIQDLFAAYVSNLTNSGTDGLLSIYVRQDAEEETKVVIHEIWASKNHLESHNRSKLFKQFQKDVIDYVDSPVVVNSAEIPHAWWLGD